MATEDSQKSAGELMSDVIGNVSSLVRNEIDLARTELADSLQSAITALVAVVIAAIVAITGLNVLTAFLISALIWAGLSAPWASLIVGVALIIIAVLIAAYAVNTFKKIGLVPTRTARNIQRDAAAVKDAYK